MPVWPELVWAFAVKGISLCASLIPIAHCLLEPGIPDNLGLEFFREPLEPHRSRVALDRDREAPSASGLVQQGFQRFCVLGHHSPTFTGLRGSSEAG
jgi:hypothetical protein